MDLGRLGLRRSHITTRNLILGGSAGKLRERGTAVAWDPPRKVVTREATGGSLGSITGRGRTPRSRSSWGLVTKCGHYSRNSQDPWDGKDILLCLCVD